MKNAFFSLLRLMKACTLLSVSLLCVSCDSHKDLQAQLQDYVDRCPAEIGVAVIVENRDTIVVNDGHYPMNSVLKMYQSLPTAIELSRREIALDTEVSVRRSELDLSTWSPMLKEYADSSFSISYGDLLKYALQQSDNNACDILFKNVLPIPDVNKFWKSKGISDFNIQWNEAQMHEQPLRSNDNWTTPLTAGCAINYMIPFAFYSSDYNTSQVGGILMQCATGQNRIPKPLEGKEAMIAHKTGTGFNDENGNPTGINDVAFVMLPDGKCYSLAVFVRTSKVDMDSTERFIADISDIVYQYVSKSETRR